MFGKPVLALSGNGGDADSAAAGSGRWGRGSPVALSLLIAVLPKCSVCLMVHGSILAATGLIAIPQPPKPIIAASLLVAVGLLARGAVSRKRWGPAAVGAVAALLLLAELAHSHGAHLGHTAAGSEHSPILTWIGSALLIIASLWNAWPAGQRRAAQVGRCLPCDAPSAEPAR